MSVLSSFVGYIFLVLLPQLVWLLLTRDQDVSALCENCSLLPPASSSSQTRAAATEQTPPTKGQTPPISSTGHASQCHGRAADNLTARLCSCAAATQPAAPQEEEFLLEKDGLGGW